MGGESSFDLLTLLAFLPSVISFFTQHKWGRDPLGPSPRSACGEGMFAKNVCVSVILVNKYILKTYTKKPNLFVSYLKLNNQLKQRLQQHSAWPCLSFFTLATELLRSGASLTREDKLFHVPKWSLLLKFPPDWCRMKIAQEDLDQTTMHWILIYFSLQQ